MAFSLDLLACGLGQDAGQRPCWGSPGWDSALMPALDGLIGQIESLTAATDLQAAAQGFLQALRPFGANGLGARAYRMPEGPIESEGIWKAGGAVAVHWPDRWADAPGFRYICLEENPLLNALKEQRSFFRYSDLAPHDRHGTYWEAFSEGRIGEGIGIVSYRPGRRVASLAVTFERLQLSPAELAGVRLAGTILIERVADLHHEPTPPPRLTKREYDCLAYVAAGKSDWEISVILKLSQATVRFHVDNARRKLDAATRAHAVARAMSLGLI